MRFRTKIAAKSIFRRLEVIHDPELRHAILTAKRHKILHTSRHSSVLTFKALWHIIVPQIMLKQGLSNSLQ